MVLTFFSGSRCPWLILTGDSFPQATGLYFVVRRLSGRLSCHYFPPTYFVGHTTLVLLPLMMFHCARDKHVC